MPRKTTAEVAAEIVDAKLSAFEGRLLSILQGGNPAATSPAQNEYVPADTAKPAADNPEIDYNPPKRKVRRADGQLLRSNLASVTVDTFRKDAKLGEQKAGSKELFPAQRDDRRNLRNLLATRAPIIELRPFVNGKQIEGRVSLEFRQTGWYAKMQDGSHEHGLQYGAEKPSIFVPLDDSGANFARIVSGGLWFSVKEVIADEL